MVKTYSEERNITFLYTKINSNEINGNVTKKIIYKIKTQIKYNKMTVMPQLVLKEFTMVKTFSDDRNITFSCPEIKNNVREKSFTGLELKLNVIK